MPCLEDDRQLLVGNIRGLIFLLVFFTLSRVTGVIDISLVVLLGIPFCSKNRGYLSSGSYILRFLLWLLIVNPVCFVLRLGTNFHCSGPEPTMATVAMVTSAS